MRDKGFVAVHRGGALSKDDHHKLMSWARKCSGHVLPLLGGNLDGRLVHALRVAKEWENGNAKTGVAMKASVSAHAVARESVNPVFIAVAGSIGHAVATAHMADHSLGAAIYALKAVSLAGKSIADERKWQKTRLKRLPLEIVELVLSVMMKKAKSLKILPGS